MTAWDISINGVNLNTEGTGVEDLSGVGGFGRSTFSRTTYAQDGESSVIGGLTAPTIGLEIWVDDCDRDSGVRPVTLEERQYVALSNARWVSGRLSGDYQMSTAITFPGPATRTLAEKTLMADTTLLTMTPPRWNNSRTMARITVALKVPGVYWRPLGGGTLDGSGFKTLSGLAGGTQLLPTSVFDMNGFVEDAIITVTNGSVPLRTVKFVANNLGAPAAKPELILTTIRTGGLMAANSTLVIDCKKHTATNTVSTTTENVFKFADYHGGRPGSILRVGEPYSIAATFTPVTTGASVAGVTWSIKYRPSFI